MLKDGSVEGSVEFVGLPMPLMMEIRVEWEG
jgi:hypothetical protein